ncbi:MAG: serine hydrolase [Vicinamibacterales bacterium]
MPDPRAEAAIIYNPITGEVVWASHERDQRSIASITKVMTSIVALDHELDLAREVVVDRADVRGARVTHLRQNDRLTIDTLLHLTLIASDNGAARVLARVSPLGTEAFIAQMNAKAVELGLEQTTYADPSGLDPENMSSAYDLARLISFASGNERMAAIMRQDEAPVTVSGRTFNIRSTNKLLGAEGVEVRAGKTGFISRAGYCLATLLRLPKGEDLAVVVLGARTNAGRFWETRHLLNWVSNRLQAVTTAPDQGVGGQQ